MKDEEKKLRVKLHRGGSMNKYRVDLFWLNDGELKNKDNRILDDWLQFNAEEGYHLLGQCQTTANDSGVYVLATMQLADETTRDPEPDTYLENYNAIA